MLTPPEIARSLLAAGESKARLPFGKMLLLAILAGAYIALAGVGATAVSAVSPMRWQRRPSAELWASWLAPACSRRDWLLY